MQEQTWRRIYKERKKSVRKGDKKETLNERIVRKLAAGEQLSTKEEMRQDRILAALGYRRQGLNYTQSEIMLAKEFKVSRRQARNYIAWADEFAADYQQISKKAIRAYNTELLQGLISDLNEGYKAGEISLEDKIDGIAKLVREIGKINQLDKPDDEQQELPPPPAPVFSSDPKVLDIDHEEVDE